MRGRSVLILVLLAAGAPAAAQTPPGGETPHPVQVFEGAIDVRVVNLEAVVTDARGRRVSGLALKDFKLLVDGVEMPITFFSEIAEKKQRISGEVAAGEETSKPAAEPSWRSRNILVFLDETSMVQARRDFVVRSLARQLDRLGSGDKMAVAAFDGSRLEVLCEWTGDRARLAAVLAAVEKRQTRGIRVEAGRREMANGESFKREVAAALEEERGGFTPPPNNVRSEGAATGGVAAGGAAGPTQPILMMPPSPDPLARFHQVTEAAAGAMRGLSAPPGRRMMMLFTEGFQSPVFAQPVIQEANRLGYSLYPVDVKGLDNFQAPNDVELTAPAAPNFITTALDRQIDYSLQTMAAATGGKASLNSNRLAALERLVEDSASYYLLGFSPTWPGDDRRHRIELAVLRPGLKVRTRDSYVDASRRTRLSLEAGAALLLGKSRSEPRLVVTAGEPAPMAGEERIPISLGVPVEALAFSPREKGFYAQAPVAVVILDETGKRKELPELWLEVETAELPLQGTYVRSDLSIPAGTRPQRIVVTVPDALSGDVLWGEARLEPPAGEQPPAVPR